MLLGIGVTIWLLHFIGVEPMILVWGVYAILGIVVGIINR